MSPYCDCCAPEDVFNESKEFSVTFECQNTRTYIQIFNTLRFLNQIYQFAIRIFSLFAN